MTDSSSKIWKHLLLLSIGLFVFGLIIARTAADIYSLVTQPATGLSYRFASPDGPAVIVALEEGGPAAKAGMLVGDTLVAINGEPVRNASSLNKAWGRLHVGESATFIMHRGAEHVILSVVPGQRGIVYMREALLGTLPVSLFAYFLCLVGTFVYLKRINDRSAIVFFLLALAFANAMRNSTPIGSAAAASFAPWWWEYISIPAWPLAVGLFLHFHLLFPQERGVIRRHPRWTLAAVYAPLLLLVPYFLFRLSGRILDIGWGIWLTGYFLVGVGLLAWSRHHADDALQRRQAQIMFWGAVLGLAPGLLYGFVPYLLWQKSLPYNEYTVLLLVIWPISIAYTIVRHRFLDVEFIVRKGVAYAILSGFVVGLYLLLVVVVGRLLLFITGISSQLFAIIATVVVAVAFNPAKNRIQDFVNRRFYRRRFSYREDVRELSRQLVKVLDLDQLLHLIEQHLRETMGIRPVEIFWREAENGRFRLRNASRPQTVAVNLLEYDEVGERLRRTSQLVDIAALERDLALSGKAIPRFWKNLHAEICLPLLEKERLVGILVLGRKESGEPYTASDIDLLQTVNDQVNIALENALLSEQLRERERIRKELEVARRIQMTSLPGKDPEVPGLEVSGISVPAYEVGGDYYDYLLLDEDRFGVVVGDVSGKGTSAALYMAKIQGIVQSLAPIMTSPRDLLLRVNKLARAGLDRRSFITMALGIFDSRRQHVVLLRAGHLPVLHYNARENRCRRLTPNGLGLGLDPGPVFDRELKPQELEFASGDIFVFYTDGVTEAMNDSLELAEIDLLEGVIAREAGKDAKAIRDAIVGAVKRHAGQKALADDMTVVVTKAVGRR